MQTPQLKPGRIYDLDPKSIIRDVKQPRKTFDKAKLNELALSLKHNGMRQPIPVRLKDGKAIIVHGERRWRAAKLAKLATVPCFLSDQNEGDFDRAAGQVAENLDREVLNPADLAAFLADLQKTHKKSTNELMAELDKRGMKVISHARIDKLLRFNEFPAWVKAYLIDGKLSEEHGVVLLQTLAFPSVMKELQGEIKRSIAWTGAITVKELHRAIEGAYRMAGRTLKTNWGDGNRLFDLKECRGCEFKKTIAGTTYCLDPKEFDKKNQQAEALQLKRDSQRKQTTTSKSKPTPTEVKRKQERREEIAGDKLSIWLDVWLRPRLLAVVAERATGLQIYALTFWLATGGVRIAKSYWMDQQHELVARNTSSLLHAAKIGNLPDAIGYAMCADHKGEREKAIAQAAIMVMDAEQLRWFARQIKFDLTAEGFAIDIGYLNLHRKAELIAVAEKGDVVPRGAGGVAGLKTDILDTTGSIERIGVPADVAELYASEPPAGDPDIFKRARPTPIDELTHALGLDSDAGMDEIIHALHIDGEKRAAEAKAEHEKEVATKARAKKKKAKAKAKPAQKKPARKKKAKAKPAKKRVVRKKRPAKKK